MLKQIQQEENTVILPVLNQPQTLIAPLEAESVSSDSVSIQIEALQIAVQARKKQQKIAKPTVIISTAFLAFLVRYALVHAGDPVGSLRWLLIPYLACSGITVWTTVAGIDRLRKRLNALANTDDVRAIGVMAQALSTGELSYGIAGSVLIRLLPKLTRKDALRLSMEERVSLRAGLKRSVSRLIPAYHNPALALAIIRSLERIGDDLDQDLLYEIAENHATSSEQLEIAAAAKLAYRSIRSREGGSDITHSAWIEVLNSTVAQPELTLEKSENLSVQLTRVARLRRRNALFTAAGAVTGFVTAIASIGISSGGNTVSGPLQCAIFASLAVTLGFAFSGTYALRNLTNALTHTDDLSVVPPLIQAAASVEVSGASAAMLLTRLLPRIRASDTCRFNAETRILLNTAITKHSKNESFVTAALKALEQIGDARAIPVVRKLAERTRGGEAVTAAAKECLGYLQTRAAEQAATETLLRPSQISDAPGTTLVRAAESNAEVAAEQLLRSVK